MHLLGKSSMSNMSNVSFSRIEWNECIAFILSFFVHFHVNLNESILHCIFFHYMILTLVTFPPNFVSKNSVSDSFVVSFLIPPTNILSTLTCTSSLSISSWKFISYQHILRKRVLLVLTDCAVSLIRDYVAGHDGISRARMTGPDLRMKNFPPRWLITDYDLIMMTHMISHNSASFLPWTFSSC